MICSLASMTITLMTSRGYSVTFARALAIFAVLTILTMVQVKFPVTDVVHWAILVWPALVLMGRLVVWGH
nr:hypothetical protein Iba_chr07aCG6970 [Ipomoea batatas]